MSHIGTCDCCGAKDVELVRAELAGLETWCCWEECRIQPRDCAEQTLHAASISLLSEGIAVTLFLAMLLLWFGVIGGQI